MYVTEIIIYKNLHFFICLLFLNLKTVALNINLYIDFIPSRNLYTHILKSFLISTNIIHS